MSVNIENVTEETYKDLPVWDGIENYRQNWDENVDWRNPSLQNATGAANTAAHILGNLSNIIESDEIDSIDKIDAINNKIKTLQKLYHLEYLHVYKQCLYYEPDPNAPPPANAIPTTTISFNGNASNIEEIEIKDIPER